MARKLRVVQPKLLRAAGLRAAALLPKLVVELFMRQPWDTLQLALRIKSLRGQADAHSRPFVRIQYMLALRAWTDHRIATAAVLMPLGTLPLLGTVLRAWVTRLRDEAQFSGDFFGYVTVHKYLARLYPNDRLVAELASALLLQTTDPLNRASALMTQVAHEPDDEKRKALIKLALAAAEASGSRAAILKILLANRPGMDSGYFERLAAEAAQCSGEAFSLFARSVPHARSASTH